MFTFGSLFTGIGGLDLGLERSGMVCEWQVENAPFCNKVLEKHWPDVPRYGDVRNVGRKNLTPVDLVVGGPPCTPHSVAGKRKGAADDRNLWPEMYRIIRELKPPWMLFENVPGIKGTILNSCLSDLEGEGYWNYRDRWGRYRIAPLVIPACGFDAPHRRYRFFIVAHTDEGCSKQPQQEICPGRDAAELCSKDVAHTPSQRNGNLSIRPGRPLEAEADAIGCCQDVAYTNSINGRARTGGENGPQVSNGSWGATQSSLGMLAHGLPPRLAGPGWLPEPPIGRVTTRVPGLTAELKALGNAVLPQVAEWLGARILEAATDET